MKASSFFGSGLLLLIGGLAALWMWLHGHRQATVHGHGSLAVARLGVRNAGRHPTRSLLTAGLLASATFLVVAVESFHRDPGKDFLTRDGGSGGSACLAESDPPTYQDLEHCPRPRFVVDCGCSSKAVAWSSVLLLPRATGR